ncbi:LysR family transcriptional regulator [Clostridium sp. AM58-1XD]|uniref:LysR family transcriptional regulator n=1 Tax=Clostridium sp. AM58-1XD TaxID=2292307 RepID=UPI000E52F911|nr:LysR family transcriptional regulator [Clostridium sp. AM58-1XD]RGY96934.1 LysR family transcriptional regulator [Clostridium sp. AM58-1XD]
MNIAQLECFLTVAENLNFARAAEQLHMTQPAVSHQIQTLESELNTKLFRRTTRSVELTEAGFLFLDDAKNIVGMAHAAKNRLSNQPEDQVIPFHIGCPGSFIYSILPGPLKKLTEDMPQIHPVIRMLPSQVLQSQLLEESLHVMFGFYEESTRKKAGTFLPLMKAPAVCVMTPEHSLAQKDILCQEDLNKGKMIICDPHRNFPELSSANAAIIGTRPVSDMYFCDTPTCAVTLIKAGLGFAILPDILPVREPGLCYIHVKGLPVLSFGLYYKKIKTHPALKTFIEIMKKEF